MLVTIGMIVIGIYYLGRWHQYILTPVKKVYIPDPRVEKYLKQIERMEKKSRNKKSESDVVITREDYDRYRQARQSFHPGEEIEFDEWIQKK